jgi:L-lactate dehydrogenase (cytochrome)
VQEHPGGAKIILKYAGQDATTAYKPIHPSDALDKNLPADKHLGSLDASSSQKLQEQQRSTPKTMDQLRVEKARKALPPLSHMLSINDITVCRCLGYLPQRTSHFRSSSKLLSK